MAKAGHVDGMPISFVAAEAGEYHSWPVDSIMIERTFTGSWKVNFGAYRAPDFAPTLTKAIKLVNYYVGTCISNWFRPSHAAIYEAQTNARAADTARENALAADLLEARPLLGNPHQLAAFLIGRGWRKV